MNPDETKIINPEAKAVDPDFDYEPFRMQNPHTGEIGIVNPEPPAVPVETPEERAERELEERFPMEKFHNTVAVLFKHNFGGRPVSLVIRGGAALAEEIMKGGRHNLTSDSGHDIVFNGNDVLWAECFTAQENRQRAIEQDVAQRAAEAQAKQASQERAEADAKLVAKTRAETRADLASEFASWGVKGYKTWLRSRQEK